MSKTLISISSTENALSARRPSATSVTSRAPAFAFTSTVPASSAEAHELSSYPATPAVSGRNSVSSVQGAALLDDDEGYPEGGYGWVVTLASFVLAFHFLGILYSWGVIQSQLEEARLAPASTLAFIGGLSAFFPAALAIPSSMLVARFGNRPVACAGMTLVGVGETLSGWATRSVPGLFVLQGGFLGVGGSLCFMSTCGLPATYFKRKRGLVTGFYSAGAGIGGAVFSVVTERLIDKIGLPWTFRALGLEVLLFGLPTCWLLRPGVTPPPASAHAVGGPSVFKNKAFIFLLASCVIVSFPFFCPPFFLPLYARSISLSPAAGAALGAGYNLASAAGRFGFGVVADFSVGNITAFVLALVMAGLGAMVVWPLSTSAGPLIVFVLLSGMGCGGYFSLQVPICGQILGSYRVSTGIGWLELGGCIGFLLGPSTAGYLLESFGGSDAGAIAYRPAMFYVGSTTLASAVLALAVRFTLSRRVFVKV